MGSTISFLKRTVGLAVIRESGNPDILQEKQFNNRLKRHIPHSSIGGDVRKVFGTMNTPSKDLRMFVLKRNIQRKSLQLNSNASADKSNSNRKRPRDPIHENDDKENKFPRLLTFTQDSKGRVNSYGEKINNTKTIGVHNDNLMHDNPTSTTDNSYPMEMDDFQPSTSKQLKPRKIRKCERKCAACARQLEGDYTFPSAPPQLPPAPPVLIAMENDNDKNELNTSIIFEDEKKKMT